tara:strand:+ start:469 stop:633 length:165 start_codon:yes stop_codon:yes gene_type:complete
MTKPFTDEEIKELKEDLIKETKGDPFGFVSALDLNVLKDPKKLEKIQDVLDSTK